MNGLFYKISLVLVAGLYNLLAWMLYSTCRIEARGEEGWQESLAKGPVVAAFWHYGIYLIMHRARRLPLVAMVSASKDGEYVSRFLNRIGIETVRGSKGKEKGGLKALLLLRRRMAETGKGAAIVADGSQGPARVVQPGAVVLASQTGAPIVPMAWAASRYHAFGSWDRSILPLPFARVVFCFGDPMTVPAGVRGAELERYRLDLEKRLNQLYEEAWTSFGQRQH